MRHNYDSYIPGAAMIVFMAAVLLFLPWLGETLFNSKGEPREAIVAVSILQSGNWILPVNYGVDIPFKPPFLAWLIAIFAKIFNGGTVNEFISRLPSALAMIAMIMAGYKWACRERGPRFAIIFSFVSMTAVEVFRAAIACRLDMVLTACMVSAIYMLYSLGEYKCRFRFLRYCAVVLLLTCATLTKGPVGALLPCFVIGVYRLFRGCKFFPTLGAMLGLSVLSMILPAWWAYAAYQQGGEHFYELMMEENIGRLIGSMSYESHVNPWWYNFVTLIAGLLPWTILVLMACFTRRITLGVPRTHAALLSLVAAVLIVGFYCIPESKRSVYLLPAYPFICYGISLIIDDKLRRNAVRAFTWLIAVLAVLAPVAIIALQIWPLPKLAMESIPWWRYIVLVLPIVAGGAWFVNRHSPVGHLLVCVWSMLLVYAAVVQPAVLNPKSDKAVLGELTQDPEASILSIAPHKAYRFYTLNFYLDDRIRLVDSLSTVASEYPSGTMVLIPQEVDTAGIYPDFEYIPLLPRSCDFRRPAGLAVKK